MNAVTDSFKPRTVTPAGAIEPMAREFLKRLAARGFAENSIIAYRADLEQFVGYMAEQRGIRFVAHITTAIVNDFIDALIDGEGVKPSTAARKLATLRKFFRFCVERGIVQPAENPTVAIDPIRFHPNTPIAPEESAVARFLEAIPRDTTIGIRDYAIFRVMFSAGLRVSGLCDLDMEPEQGEWRYGIRPSGVVYYRKKGGDLGETLITDDETLRAVDEWLRVRSKFATSRTDNALFLTERGTRVNRHSLHARAKLHGAASGMPEMHCHLLRHARISQALEKSDLHVAHYLTGHKNKATTVNMYGHQSRERLRERLRRDAPLGV